MQEREPKKIRRRLPRRWPLIRLADTIVALAPRAKKRSDAVVLRLFGIGDALLFRAVIGKYAEALNVPTSHMTVLGSTSWAAAADLFFRDIDVMLIDERKFARNFAYRLRTMLALRRRGFNTAICGMRFRYPHVIESLMLASGAARRIVAVPRANEKFDAMFAHYRPRMTQVVALREPDKPRAGDGQPLPLAHEIERELAFLSAVAGRPVTLETLPNLTLPVRAPPLVKQGERYAVLNIGASHAPRRWPLAHFFELARRLGAAGYTVVFLGGPAEAELKNEVQAFAARFPSAIVAIDEIDFAAAAQLVNHAAVVVSSDTGIGHLALMLGRPAVLMVGGGHFGSFMPYPAHLTPPRARFLYELMPCYHCNWNCSMMPPGGKTFPCVERIAAETVWRAVSDIADPAA